MGRRELIEEARLQTAAIGRLGAWLRLACSLAAIGAILVLWGTQKASPAAVAAGVACLVIGVPISVILKIGIAHARSNVEKILEAAGAGSSAHDGADERSASRRARRSTRA